MRKKNLMELKTLKETQFLLEAIREKRTSGAEAVMAEAMSVPEHVKKWRKIIGSGKRWRCHFWAVYNPRSEKDTGSEEKKL